MLANVILISFLLKHYANTTVSDAPSHYDYCVDDDMVSWFFCCPFKNKIRWQKCKRFYLFQPYTVVDLRNAAKIRLCNSFSVSSRQRRQSAAKKTVVWLGKQID